ncbi:MAG TPA: hypothetical protein VFD94_04330 [Jatrophihabitans sp.]|jgi:hypothetical protein|nr:hypothetical protein [Jatrophihabitans sp.]
MIRRLLHGIAAAAVATAALGALSSPVDAAESSIAATTPPHGCPSGYFCIYASDATWNSGDPSYAFYTYGAHDIYNQYGSHWVYNHQTGGAFVFFCEGANGAAPVNTAISAPNYANKWPLGPVNSIVLEPATYKGTGYVASSCATDAHNQGWYP